jgi:hypothetical protein
MSGRGRQYDRRVRVEPAQARAVLWNAVTICVLLGVAYGISSSAGCSSRCLLNSDCTAGRICVEGGCLIQCVRHPDCPLEQFCFNEGCRPLRPEDPPVCRYDTGCGDAVIEDGGAIDAALDAGRDGRGLSDSSLGEGGLFGEAGVPRGDGDPPIVGEAGLGDGASLRDAISRDRGIRDGFMGDGPPPPEFDLTGVYVVNSTLIVDTGGPLTVGEVERRIGTLRWRHDAIYRLEILGQEADFLFNIDELDIASVEGPTRYQFEYERDYTVLDCDVHEIRFQRGRFIPSTDGFRMFAAEERNVSFSGEECNEQDYFARFSVVWSPVPDP